MQQVHGAAVPPETSGAKHRNGSSGQRLGRCMRCHTQAMPIAVRNLRRVHEAGEYVRGAINKQALQFHRIPKFACRPDLEMEWIELAASIARHVWLPGACRKRVDEIALRCAC